MSKNEPNRNLVVKYIPKEIPDQEMLDLFSEFGPLVYYKFHKRQEQQIKMSFITYKTLEQAESARLHLNSYKIKGYQRHLYCCFNQNDHKQTTSKFNRGTEGPSNFVPTNPTSFPSNASDPKSPDDNSKMICVLVTHIEDMKVFWGQIIDEEQSTQRPELPDQINNYCQSVLNGETKIDESEKPLYFAAKFADGKWYRVEVKNEREEHAFVLYIDYGNSSMKPINELIPLPKDLCFPPTCFKYAILDSKGNFNIKSIFDKYIHITPIEPHSTDPNCTIVKISQPSSDASVGYSENLLRNNSATNAQSYKISPNPASTLTQRSNAQVSDSSGPQLAPQNAFNNQGMHSYQQQQVGYSVNTAKMHNSIDTTSPMQRQPNPLPQAPQLPSPQYSNVFTFPATPVTSEHSQQSATAPHQYQPQPQPQQLQQNSAFQAYQKGSNLPESPLQTISTVLNQDHKYPKYDPLHGPELLNRYRQELEEIDDRMKATSSRVITLESVNSDLRNENEFLKSPENFQQLLHKMMGKVREFLAIKRQMFSIEEVSSLREIAQEVLSNRGRLSLSQMSEVVEVHSLQDQIADLTNLIRSNSNTTEEPLGQLIAQRDECRSKLLTAIASLIETLNNFPLEERCGELNARRARLTQVPGYTPVEPKPIDLTVCLETYESVQSFDWKELKLGQEDEEGLEELSARLTGSLKFYLKLLRLDPSEEIEEDETEFAALIHKIVQTADNDISTMKNMEDVHKERRKTASCSLMEAIAYELNRELEEVQSIQTSIIPQLRLEQERLQAWQNNTPCLTKLLTLRKEIKKVRTGLRHLRVDYQEAIDDSHLENMSKIQDNIKSVLESFHQSLLTEHGELWHLAELANLHFSELPILYPDLGLERQMELGPIYNPGWEQDYFGDLEEVGFFQEPTYLTVFNKESCLLRELKLSSVDQQPVLANNLTKLYGIQHNSVLKCDAFFFSKSGLKAFLKHPSIEGGILTDFFQANQSGELPSKWLFSQILHGLSAIHELGLHCKCLTGKDIFISTDRLHVLITSIDLLSEASGQQIQLMHQFDLFNFCTLALSLLTSYEQDVLNLQPANIEDLIRDSGLDDCTISFLTSTISKTTTAPFLASQGYFDELTKLTPSHEHCEDRETKPEVENEKEHFTEKENDGDEADDSEALKIKVGSENSSVEGDNEEVQLLMNKKSS